MTRQEALNAAKQNYLKVKDWSKQSIEGLSPIARAFWESRRAAIARPRPVPSQVLPIKPRQLFHKSNTNCIR